MCTHASEAWIGHGLAFPMLSVLRQQGSMKGCCQKKCHLLLYVVISGLVLWLVVDGFLGLGVSDCKLSLDDDKPCVRALSLIYLGRDVEVSGP